MVHLSGNLFARIALHTSKHFAPLNEKVTDRSWRHRRVLMQTAHFFGRKRNCFRIARNYQLKAIGKATMNRAQFSRDINSNSQMRIEASAGELHFDGWYAQETMTRAGIALNKLIIANLAIWEPRSFRGLVAIMAKKFSDPCHNGGMGKKKCGPDIEVISGGKI